MKTKSLHTEIAFTLVELLVVVSIIAIISAIGVPRLIRAFHQARDKKVMSTMRNFAIAIGIYRIDNEMVPDTTDLSELVLILTTYQGEELIPLTERDSWGHEFYYRRVSAEEYTLKSFGRDGTPGNPANVTYFDPDADLILITGVFAASHEGTAVVVGK